MRPEPRHIRKSLDNFHNAFASIYEGRYLAGITAGMKLNEMIANGEITEDQAKMGYVGAYTYAEVISGYTSFFLGARSVCPSVTMEVTFTGSWYDETAEKEGANKLIDERLRADQPACRLHGCSDCLRDCRCSQRFLQRKHRKCLPEYFPCFFQNQLGTVFRVCNRVA